MPYDDESSVANNTDLAGELALRPAVFDFESPRALDDARFLLELRNEPGYRTMAAETRLIGWDEHIDWYRNAGRLRGRHIWIVQGGQARIGMVRLDEDDGQRHAVEVSLALCPQCRGRGIGTAVLARACAEAVRLGYDTVHARVRPTNQRSLRSFAKTGFVVTELDQQETAAFCRLQWRSTGPR